MKIETDLNPFVCKCEEIGLSKEQTEAITEMASMIINKAISKAIKEAIANAADTIKDTADYEIISNYGII